MADGARQGDSGTESAPPGHPLYQGCRSAEASAPIAAWMWRRTYVEIIKSFDLRRSLVVWLYPMGLMCSGSPILLKSLNGALGALGALNGASDDACPASAGTCRSCWACWACWACWQSHARDRFTAHPSIIEPIIERLSACAAGFCGGPLHLLHAARESAALEGS